MVSCEECWKLLRGDCVLYYEVHDAYKQYKDAQNRSLRLDETKEQYYTEVRKLRRIWKNKRIKQLRCFNRRKYCQLKVGYNYFNINL